MKKSRLRFVIPLIAFAFVLLAARLWSRREPTFKTPTEAQLQRFYPANTRKVFENATTWTLFSIEPKANEESKDAFHGHKILGQTTVKDVATCARLQKALYGAIADLDGEIASCFNPHHGLRATYKNQTVDLIVCFSCGTSYFYVGEERLPTAVAPDSRDAEKVWNRVLESAGVDLPRKELIHQIFD